MPSPGRPNLLVFLTDDHAAWAARCYGSRELETPCLDELAREGLRATRAFTPNPVCSPGRACFFTGRLPSQHGIHDWLQESPERPRDWLAGEVTLPQLLQAHGYRTGLVGKWHCGNSHLPQPGFDHWFSYERGQYPHVGRHHFIEDGRRVEWHGRQAELLADKAAAFIARDDGRPFFLCVGFVDTHSPFCDQPEDLVARYAQATFADIPTEDAATPGWVRFGTPRDEDRRRRWLAHYYAAVSLIDRQVGRVLAALRARGIEQETLVVYTSDHGHMNGHHGLYTKGNATVPQNLYDESIRVPLLARWPGRLPAARTLDVPVDHCDLFQTLLDAARCPVPRGIDYPGASFLPQLEGRSQPWRDAQFCEYGNARMIRTEAWKYIQRLAPHAHDYGDELYDLASDPRETVNRIANPGLASTVASLRERLEAHFRRHEVPDRSGRNILALPAQNAWEPWRLTRPAHTPPEGSEWAVLDRF